MKPPDRPSTDLGMDLGKELKSARRAGGTGDGLIAPRNAKLDAIGAIGLGTLTHRGLPAPEP
ncbi:hypothetical protein [Limnothrix redekei]|uniref:Uncharacterized protein n=1 Tax=Limnothrix redekei LRLZ20PSL1 TaxID=3112953 RepID=A0ABW7CE59_9CYAN